MFAVGLFLSVTQQADGKVMVGKYPAHGHAKAFHPSDGSSSKGDGDETG